MKQITAQVPDQIVSALDAIVEATERTRDEIITHALESYLEDFDGIAVAKERLNDPNDATFNWDEVKNQLLTSS